MVPVVSLALRAAPRAAFALALAASSWLGGCVTAEEEARPVLVGSRVELASDALGRVVVEGAAARQATFVVHFPDDARATVARASAFMPAHGHGTSPPAVRPLDDGRYEISPVRLYMPGRWAVDVVVAHPGVGEGAEETVSFDVDVE